MLKMDGLDRMRDRLDELQMMWPDYVFRIITAHPPHPANALQVEAYNNEQERWAGVVIWEEHVENGEWVNFINKMEVAMKKAEGVSAGDLLNASIILLKP